MLTMRTEGKSANAQKRAWLRRWGSWSGESETVDWVAQSAVERAALSVGGADGAEEVMVEARCRGRGGRQTARQLRPGEEEGGQSDLLQRGIGR